MDGEKYSPKTLERLNPQELNGILHNLYEQVPAISPLEAMEIDPHTYFAERERREKSEHLKIVAGNVDSLLDFAHNQLHSITNGFRQFLSIRFWTAYIQGRDKNDPSIDPFYEFLDMDHPESGGVFDPLRAKELEQRGYRQELASLSPNRLRLESTARRHGFVLEIVDQIVKAQELTLHNWRNEFLEKHHEEP